MTELKMTKSQEVAADVAALLRARTPLIWIVTREEARVERYLIEAAAAANYAPKTWDVAQGFAGMDGKVLTNYGGSNDPGAAMSMIAQAAQPSSPKARGLWIMRDLTPWLQGPPFAAQLRQLRNLTRSLPATDRDHAQAVVVLSPSGEVPAEIAATAAVIEWPLPDREEVGAILDAAIKTLPQDLQANAAPNGTREAAVDSAVGLSAPEAQACYAKSLVQLKRIDPTLVAKEKKRVVTREKVLEWFDPLPGGLDSVGGLDVLKSWLQARKAAYSPAARAYGLPAPKGVVLFGVQGCGKSLTAKAVSTAWNCPLLKLDLGALKSKFVGDSEANIRKAFKVIEALGKCVVWIDEIEKAMQGATSGSADGGVSSDALGAILSWMQERAGEAFVIATANDIEGLPPELLRKGRFDEIFWVDLPTAKEREAVLAATLKSYKRAPDGIDLKAVAQACNDFTGAEIAAIVPEAMFAAFNDNAREPTTADLIAAAGTVVPLAKTAEEKINKLRSWSKGRTRPATSQETATVEAGGELDIN